MQGIARRSRMQRDQIAGGNASYSLDLSDAMGHDILVEFSARRRS